MHKTPKWIFDKIARERPPCERNALFHDHVCVGRSTMEHAWLYGGKQINEEWAIIRLCEWAHLGNGLDKQINHLISLLHADIEDIKRRYPRKDWEQEINFLMKRYGDKIRLP